MFINAHNEKIRAQANFFMSEANREEENDPTLALRLSDRAISLGKSKDSIILFDAHKIYHENIFYKAILKHTDEIDAVAFSPDGTTVLTGSDDNTAGLWNVVTLDEFLKSDNLAPLEQLLLTDKQKKKYRVD